MTSSSTSNLITPLAEQSTLEEDYFADLLLDDDPDEVVAPTSRENRMNRAFEDSKRIYQKGDALTEPGWHVGLEQDPRIRQDPDSSIRQAFDAKIADSSMVHLYRTRSYRPCLDLCLAWIATNSSDTSSASVKETMDTAMRAAIALGDKESCLKVADMTRRWWKMNGNSAVTHTAARALSIAGHYRGSFIAMLFAIADRGVHLQFLVDVESSLVSWRSEESDRDVLAAIDALLPPVQRCGRTAAAALGPRLFNSGGSVEVVREQQPNGENDNWPHIPLNEECDCVAHGLQLDDTEREPLAKFCKKILAVKEWERMRMKNGGVDAANDLQDQGRSVRTL